jgi:predicted RNA binding protein YcfA (HicA-like mRNA interferase family)
MSPRLPRITAVDLIRALERDGWAYVRQRGSHRFLAHADRPGLVVVPMHAGKTIKLGLLKRILDDAGLTPEDLEKLL